MHGRKERQNKALKKERAGYRKKGRQLKKPMNEIWAAARTPAARMRRRTPRDLAGKNHCRSRRCTQVGGGGRRE